MHVGHSTTTRDLALSTPVQQAGPSVPSTPAVESTDTFGPATRIALSNGGETSFAAVAPVQSAPRPAVENVEKVISVDPETRSLVYQNRNEDTGVVVSQFPDDAKLRLRAYFDELTQQQTQAATAGTHPDPSTIDGIRV
jgi:hypothetical protein